MSNFGFGRLRLVNPYHVAFQEARSAVHAHQILREAARIPDAGRSHRRLQPGGGNHVARPSRTAAPAARRWNTAAGCIRKRLAAAPVRAAVRLRKVRPLERRHELLPLAAAHRDRRIHESRPGGGGLPVRTDPQSRTAQSPISENPPTAEELDRLTGLLTEVLEQSGYLHSEGADAKIRRLVRRLNLAGHDAEIWLGMIRQIHWKLTCCKPSEV